MYYAFRWCRSERRAGSLVLTALLLAWLCSCASSDVQVSIPPPAANTAINPDSPVLEQEVEPTVVAFRDYKDPLIGFNRLMFGFNDVSYRYLLIPAAVGYTRHVPEPVRTGVGNFYYNLKSPIYLVNNLLQGQMGDAGNTLLRFGINTTLGILGIFDPATSRFELPKTDSSLNATMMQYGVGYGTYLVLPLLGSSDLRRGTSSIVEVFLHPALYLTEGGDRVLLQGFGAFQEIAPQAPRYEELTQNVDDPYIFLRNLYLQDIERNAAFINIPQPGENEPEPVSDSAAP